MNIICILAGGNGNRFGSPVPKQYHLINGRPVIEYVIDAAVKSSTDEVIVASNAERKDELEQKYGVITIEGGVSRNQSIGNALDYISRNYSCSKLILVDAVCPLVRTDLFDLYFNYLDEYDAVFTVADVTTSLARKDGEKVNRRDYLLVESPDSYRFELIKKTFDAESEYTTPLHMLPKDARVKLNFDFRDYMKIMYPHDLAVAEALLRERERHIKFEAHSDDAVLALFAKLRKINRQETKQWEKRIDKDVEGLFSKWKIYEFSVNHDAYTGLVLECKSQKYGDVVVKMYPPFLHQRYVKESFIMKTLKGYPQAPLLDLDEELNAMLLGRIIPGDYIDFNTNQPDIAIMFQKMQDNRIRAVDLKGIPSEIKAIVDQTADEFVVARGYDYYPKMVEYLFDCMKRVYAEYFLGDEKYLLHGDAYYKNALCSTDGIRVIDPVGYVDAFVFEYMPMLTYELVMHTSPEEYLNQYRKMVDFFSTFEDVSKFNASTFVFLVKQLIPSIYEANDGYKRADSFMNVIRALFLNSDNEFVLIKYEV